MGIDPAVFGPHLWASLHLIALGAPASLGDAERAVYKAFFTSIAGVIPCGTCGQHFAATLDNLPIDNALSGGGAEELFAWTVAVHNAVNTRLGKPQVSVENAREIWLPKSISSTFVNPLANKNDVRVVNVTLTLACALCSALLLIALAVYAVTRSSKKSMKK